MVDINRKSSTALCRNPIAVIMTLRIHTERESDPENGSESRLWYLPRRWYLQYVHWKKLLIAAKQKMKIDQWQIGKLEQKFRRGFRNNIESYLKKDASTNFISFSF